MCIILLEAIIDGVERLIKFVVSFATKQELEDEEFFYDHHDGVEDLPAVDGETINRSNCRVFCSECGTEKHIAKKKCDNCGFEKPAKSIDWSLIKSKSPRCPYYTTRCLFKRVCQLHARHNRDVVVLLRHRSNDRDMFRFWGTPGAGEEFISGKLGAAVKEAWAENFTQKSLKRLSSGKSPPTKRIKTEEYSEKISPETDAPCSIVELPNDNQVESDLEEDDDEIYKVETILDKKKEDGISFYLVKWSGWASDFNTWEPEENIIDKSLLDKFV